MSSAPSLTAQSRRPRVGFVTESFLEEGGAMLEGGAERHLLRLASVASAVGADVTVYQRGRPGVDRFVDGIRVVSLPAPLTRLGRTLGARAVADGCTHLHFQNLPRVPWSVHQVPMTATALAVYWDIPYDHRYYKWYPGQRLAAVALPAWRYHELSRCLLAVGRCQRVLATDTSLLRLVQSFRPALRHRVDVVKDFTDLLGDTTASLASADADPAVAPLVESRRAGHTVILVPRNLSFVRGGAWLCEIVERTTAMLPVGRECHFFLTGVPIDVYGRAARYRRLLEDHMNAMSAEGRRRLHLLSGLPRASMAAAYRASDIVLIPTFANEGTSLAALEALGLGVPVVATTVGGLNDIIEDGTTGLLVTPEPSAIARGVTVLAEDAELRGRLGDAGRRMATAAFTLEHWAARAEAFARRAGWAADVETDT
jgi:glycosyltransferase involved in cell wall biosynthesis